MMATFLDTLYKDSGLSKEVLAGVGLQLPTSKPATSPAACQRHGMRLDFTFDESRRYFEARLPEIGRAHV